jgi:hypothetical protein
VVQAGASAFDDAGVERAASCRGSCRCAAAASTLVKRSSKAMREQRLHEAGNHFRQSGRFSRCDFACPYSGGNVAHGGNRVGSLADRRQFAFQRLMSSLRQQALHA